MILEADSEEEARRFMENDPFVANGLMRARLHPYRAALVRRVVANGPHPNPPPYAGRSGARGREKRARPRGARALPPPRGFAGGG